MAKKTNRSKKGVKKVSGTKVLVCAGGSEMLVFSLDEKGKPIGFKDFFQPADPDCGRNKDEYDIYITEMPLWILSEIRVSCTTDKKFVQI